LTQVWAALGKELLLQWRTRAHFTATLAFGAAALFLFSFAGSPDPTVLRGHAAGFLWLGLLLASTLSLAEGFHREMEQGALEGLLLLPSPAAALFYGKAIANAVELTLLGVGLVPVMIGLYDAGTSHGWQLIGVVALGAAGLAAPGTLYAAMASQARAGQVLLPLLLYPLVIPALVASVNATSLFILGDPMHQARSWLLLLACFDALYWITCGLLFDRVVEE
jgi:heme exporter protein B